MHLIRRTRPERWAGKWVIPGAVLLFEEDPSSAARRVVAEQLGAAATSVKLLDVQSYGDKHRDLCFVHEVELDRIGDLVQDFDKAEFFELDGTLPQVRDDHLEVIKRAMSSLSIREHGAD